MAEQATTTVATVKSANTNQRAVRAIVIGVNKQAEPEPGQSTALPNDPFSNLMHRGDVIEPPFDMLTLAMLPEHNSELGQVIEAMETNIDGFGYRFVPRIRVGEPGNEVPQNILDAMRKEQIELINFFAYAALEDSFTTFRRKLRKDMETTGNAYFEVIRNAAGKIQGFTHIPSYQIRLGKVEDNPIEVDWPIMEMQLDSSVQVATIKRWKRFRKFAQSRFITMRNLSTLGGAKVRWFKEFGDPRQYNNETGELLDAKKTAGVAPERLANEMVHLKIYCARSPYGLPRYIGNLLSIFGDRAAEEINYVTFRNNNIPSMVVLVSNGQLTEGSIKRIESFVESQIQGSDNYSKFLLLEAEGALEKARKDGRLSFRIPEAMEEVVYLDRADLQDGALRADPRVRVDVRVRAHPLARPAGFAHRGHGGRGFHHAEARVRLPDRGAEELFHPRAVRDEEVRRRDLPHVRRGEGVIVGATEVGREHQVDGHPGRVADHVRGEDVHRQERGEHPKRRRAGLGGGEREQRRAQACRVSRRGRNPGQHRRGNHRRRGRGRPGRGCWRRNALSRRTTWWPCRKTRNCMWWKRRCFCGTRYRSPLIWTRRPTIRASTDSTWWAIASPRRSRTLSTRPSAARTTAWATRPSSAAPTSRTTRWRRRRRGGSAHC